MEIRKASPRIEFGGVALVEPVADRQRGPTCGFEAIENVIQLFRPFGNDLVERDLIARAHAYGALYQDRDGYSLQVHGYQSILRDYGISASWYPFDDLRVLVPALRLAYGVLAVVDAHPLDPTSYPKRPSGHAVVVTNFITDASDHLLWRYSGIDSNFAGQETVWPWANFQLAAKFVSPALLITDQPANWPRRVDHYARMPNGTFVPMLPLS